MKEIIKLFGGMSQYRELVKTFDCNPVGKPRMTQRDKWADRPIVSRYYAYKDTLALQRRGWVMQRSGLHIYFCMPMPPSWSKRKTEKMAYSPHMQTPDIDNLVKAFFDALTLEDKDIWNLQATKLWSKLGRIFITLDRNPFIKEIKEITDER